MYISFQAIDHPVEKGLFLSLTTVFVSISCVILTNKIPPLHPADSWRSFSLKIISEGILRMLMVIALYWERKPKPG